MAVSAVARRREQLRQAGLNNDRQYYKKLPYVFVLNQEGARTEFPLVMNPTNFEYTLPFAAEVTPTQDGGIISEEAGWTIGELNITATTGYQLREPLDNSSEATKSRFTSQIGHGSDKKEEVSGQANFWRLANRCFEKYSELKKDPERAAGVTMEFHSVKDDLHLHIVPQEFKLMRDTGSRAHYIFSLRAAVVGSSRGLYREFPSPEKSLIDDMKDGISKVRQALQEASAAVDDVTASIDEISRAINSFPSFMTDVTNILNSATDLVNGTKTFMNLPKGFIRNVGQAATDIANFASTVAAWPADVAQSFRQISDQFNRMEVAAGEFWSEKFKDVGDRYSRLGDPVSRGPLRDEINSRAAQQATDSVGGLPVQTAFSGAKAGDQRRSRNQLLTGRGRINGLDYQGFQERIVGQGDTIQSLSAKYLGDARRWMDLVVANRLKPPYITTQAKIPGTRAPGDRIVVPIATQLDSPNVLTTGQGASSSQIEDSLGTDFELVQQPSGRFGWELNAQGNDIQTIKGVANIEQAISTRLRTEQGTNVLYPNLGLPKAVGRSNLDVDNPQFQQDVQDQLLADSRIETVRSFSFEVDGDSLKIEADIQPIGFDSSRVISRTLT